MDIWHDSALFQAAGINVSKGANANILEENIVQPFFVSTSSIKLASETVKSILSQRYARLKVIARQYWICHFFEFCHNMILNLVYNLVSSTVELTAS